MSKNMPAFLAELTEVCRRYGYAIDIGDGEFLVYSIDAPGSDRIAALSWDRSVNGLVLYEYEEDVCP